MQHTTTAAPERRETTPETVAAPGRVPAKKASARSTRPSPSEPASESAGARPSRRTRPSRPKSRSGSTEPVDPVQTVEAAKATESVESTKAARPAQAVKPAKADRPERSSTAVGPSEPPAVVEAGSASTVELAESTGTVRSAGTAGSGEIGGTRPGGEAAVHERRQEEVSGLEDEHLNEIVLVGRVTAEPAIRDLPSGDRLATWRICVSRPPDTRFRGRRVDSITCVSFDTWVHDQVRELRLGDVVRMSGALRRRTWRGYDGVRSVHEVEVRGAALVRAVRSRGTVRR